MASRGVSALKFVGTVSLGLLTGLSYSLTTLTVPALLDLPSASTAQRVFKTLSTEALAQISSLTGLSGAAFALAFTLSPRAFRHPYLLYTSALVLGSRAVLNDNVASLFLTLPQKSASSSPSSATPRQSRRDRPAGTSRMEMSYDVIGNEGHSDSASDKSIEDDGIATPATDNVNGEEVRVEVEGYLKKQVISTGLSMLGFFVAVVGIWGDGAASYVSEAYVNVVGI